MIGSSLFAQKIPNWYQELIDQKEGEWVTDNSKYLSDSETTAHYTLKWWKSSNEKDLHGVLMDENEKVIWSYYQYFDKKNGVAVLNQLGLDGIHGRGVIESRGDTIMVNQEFKNSQNASWKEVHHTIRLEDGLEKTISYSYDKNFNLIKGRVYEWEKQVYIKL